jgi:hypothetical protein
VALANPTPHVDTIIALAQEIAQVAPECAGKALKIIDAARELGERPDRAMIEDAIESKLIDSELSEPQLQSVTSAVVGSINSNR